jgi:hypothetical protein
MVRKAFFMFLPTFEHDDRLIFASADKIDAIWSGIASRLFLSRNMDELSDNFLPQASLVSGPLNLSTAFLAKVSTSSESDSPGAQQHLICVYLSDVYDKPSVTEVSFCSYGIQMPFH